ncbi:MAG: T9SS type A sorting domain-containing protein [Hyphomicrobiales bacterium]
MKKTALLFTLLFALMQFSSFAQEKEIEIVNEGIHVSGLKILEAKKYVMAPQAYISVEPGATLIIESGAEFDSREGFWQGIFVGGVSVAPQGEYHGLELQGKLIIKPNVKVSHSNFGIVSLDYREFSEVIAPKMEAGKYINNMTAFNTSGGIIEADGLEMYNNKHAALIFYPYDYSNESVISNSTFYFDEFEAGYHKNNMEFVKLFDNDGVKFVSCTFEYDNNRNGIFSEAFYGVDSDVEVLGTEYKPTKFINTTSYFTSYTGDETVTFRGCHFLAEEELMKLPLFVEEVGNFVFEHNLVQVVEAGLHIWAVENFSIQENRFEKAWDNEFATGITIIEPGDNAKIIYRNSFDGLNTGIKIQDPAEDNTNICFACNIFKNNFEDENEYTGDIYMTEDVKILPVQAQLDENNNYLPAANLFTDVAPNIMNTGNDQAVEYHYNAGNDYVPANYVLMPRAAEQNWEYVAHDSQYYPENDCPVKAKELNVRSASANLLAELNKVNNAFAINNKVEALQVKRNEIISQMLASDVNYKREVELLEMNNSLKSAYKAMLKLYKAEGYQAAVSYWNGIPAKFAVTQSNHKRVMQYVDALEALKNAASSLTDSDKEIRTLVQLSQANDFIASYAKSLVASMKSEKKNISIQNSAVEMNHELAVYPNPANSKINVTFNANTDDLLKVSVVNLLGQRVKSFDFVAGQENVLSISDIKQGVYMITIESGSRVLDTKKVIIK